MIGNSLLVGSFVAVFLLRNIEICSEIIIQPDNQTVFVDGAAMISCYNSFNEPVDWAGSSKRLKSTTGFDMKNIYSSTAGLYVDLPDSRFDVVASNGSGFYNLTISNVTVDDSGQYLCKDGRNFDWIVARLYVSESSELQLDVATKFVESSTSSAILTLTTTMSTTVIHPKAIESQAYSAGTTLIVGVVVGLLMVVVCGVIMYRKKWLCFRKTKEVPIDPDPDENVPLAPINSSGNALREGSFAKELKGKLRWLFEKTKVPDLLLETLQQKAVITQDASEEIKKQSASDRPFVLYMDLWTRDKNRFQPFCEALNSGGQSEVVKYLSSPITGSVGGYKSLRDAVKDNQTTLIDNTDVSKKESLLEVLVKREILTKSEAKEVEDCSKSNDKREKAQMLYNKLESKDFKHFDPLCEALRETGHKDAVSCLTRDRDQVIAT